MLAWCLRGCHEHRQQNWEKAPALDCALEKATVLHQVQTCTLRVLVLSTLQGSESRKSTTKECMEKIIINWKGENWKRGTSDSRIVYIVPVETLIMLLLSHKHNMYSTNSIVYTCKPCLEQHMSTSSSSSRARSAAARVWELLLGETAKESARLAARLKECRDSRGELATPPPPPAITMLRRLSLPLLLWLKIL